MKTRDRNSKPRREFRLESQIKRLRQQARMLKRNIKKSADGTEQPRKLELKKAWGDQPKNTSKRRKTEKVPRQDYTIWTKQDIPKQRKKLFQQLEGEWAKPYQQPDAKEARRFWSKISERRDHNKKAEWINNMETELRMLEESPQVNIHPDGLKATLTKITNWKTPDLDGIHRFLFENSTTYTTDLLRKLINAYRKLRYPNEWSKGRPL